jgi:hypothetical protein
MPPQPGHHRQLFIQLQQEFQALRAAIVADMFEEFPVRDAAVLSLARREIRRSPQHGAYFTRKFPREFWLTRHAIQPGEPWRSIMRILNLRLMLSRSDARETPFRTAYDDACILTTLSSATADVL